MTLEVTVASSFPTSVNHHFSSFYKFARFRWQADPYYWDQASTAFRHPSAVPAYS